MSCYRKINIFLITILSMLFSPNCNYEFRYYKQKTNLFSGKWDKRADILLYFYNKEKKKSFFCSNYHAKSSSQFGENNVDILVAKKMLVFLFQITLLSWHFFWKTRSNFKLFCYQIPKKSRIYQCIFHKKNRKIVMFSSNYFPISSYQFGENNVDIIQVKKCWFFYFNSH